jgi:glutamyl/glutaminyl-tRNA synthetase
MARKAAHVSETPATQWLRRHGVAFSEHVYDYVDHGGTAESARQLGVDEHHVVKTLVMEDERARPLIVLMHGDRSVSTTALARELGDVVLARKDVPASYHLAVVHDDALQGVTTVIRGADLAFATPLHRVLQALLELPAPEYRHHRLITDAAGKRFAKRDGAATLRALRAEGVTPAEVRARLGLGPS